MNKPDLTKCKDKSVLEYIEHLETKLDNFTKNTYCDSYLSLKRIVDKGNQQIATIEIDILTDDGEKQYKSIAKFASQLKEYGEQMEYFKSKMTVQEVDKIDGVVIKKVVDKKVGIAEKMAINNKDGKNTSI
jgi:hypothetical protein